MSGVIAVEAKEAVSPKEATKHLFDRAMGKSEAKNKSANDESEKSEREERLKDRAIIAKALYSGDLDARDYLLEVKEHIDSVKSEKDAAKIIYLTRSIMENAHSEVQNALSQLENNNKKNADKRTREAVYDLRCENARGKGILDVKKELYGELWNILKRKPDETDEDYAKRGANAAIHVIRILNITGAIGINSIKKEEFDTLSENKERAAMVQKAPITPEEIARQFASNFMHGILSALIGSKEPQDAVMLQINKAAVEIVKDEVKRAGSPSDTGLEAVIKLLKQKMDADLK